MNNAKHISNPPPCRWEWHEVRNIIYSVHVKRGAPADHPRTLRVDYRIGHQHWVSEWVCLEHRGFAKERAIEWWHRHSKAPLPRHIEEAVFVANNGGLADTLQVATAKDFGSDYIRVVGYRLGPVPAWDAAKFAAIQNPWMTETEIKALNLPFDYTIINEEVL